MLMVLSLIPRVVAMVLCTESMYWVEQVTSSPPSSLGLETIRRTITMMRPHLQIVEWVSRWK